MRGYFGIGVEGISKPMNLGNLLRSAHAFGASFFFTIDPAFNARETKRSDTSDAAKHLPLYCYDDVSALSLPRGCRLVGVELLDEAEALPSFRHPSAAAYVLGPERGSLSPALTQRCDHCDPDPDQVLRQHGRGRRHRHVRPHDLPGPLRAPAGRLHGPGRAACRSYPRPTHLARSLARGYIKGPPRFVKKSKQFGT